MEPSSASQMEPVVETLKNMNVQTGKHATWLVRVLAPKVVKYKFHARGAEVQATRFVCILVSKDPRQFMLGSVPFSFSDTQAAAKAFLQFTEGKTFEIKNPEFDMKMKAEYISTPLKRAVLMTKPTVITAIPPTELHKQKHPANHVDLGLTLQEVMKALDSMSWTGSHAAASGTAVKSTQLMNVCGKILSFEPEKSIIGGGQQRKVAALFLVDDTNATVEIHVWDAAITAVRDIPVGHGVTIIGCTATRGGGEAPTKLNMWDSAYVLRGGPKAQSLTSLELDGSGGERLTATFTPGASQGPLLPPDAEGFPTCAASLACAPVLPHTKVFQMNRCLIDAPTHPESMFTQDGKRLFATCRLRDWSGGVDVDVVEEAMPQLYGKTTPDEVREALATGTLTPKGWRVNARGVIKSSDAGVRKFYICKLHESPLDVRVSGDAMRVALGLADVTGDVVVAAPVDRVKDAPLLGLAVRSNAKGFIAAHRVLLLVKGTSQSVLRQIGIEGQSLATQSFQVQSYRAKCLLSDDENEVDLHGYCNFQDMLQYRLDKDVALVLVSAWDHGDSSKNPVCTIEAMTKVSDVESVRASMRQEWKAALTCAADADKDEYLSPMKSDYWDRDVKKLKRMESEPVDSKD